MGDGSEDTKDNNRRKHENAAMFSSWRQNDWRDVREVTHSTRDSLSLSLVRRQCRLFNQNTALIRVLGGTLVVRRH